MNHISHILRQSQGHLIPTHVSSSLSVHYTAIQSGVFLGPGGGPAGTPGGGGGVLRDRENRCQKNQSKSGVKKIPVSSRTQRCQEVSLGGAPTFKKKPAVNAVIVVLMGGGGRCHFNGEREGGGEGGRALESVGLGRAWG